MAYSSALSNLSSLPIASPDQSLSLKDWILAIANLVLNNALLVAGVLAVFFLILAGMRYIVSRGDPNQSRLARDSVLHIIIGVVIIVACFWIVRFAVGLGQSLSSAT